MAHYRKIFSILLLPIALFASQHYWAYVHKIIEEENRCLNKKYRLSPCASGGGGIDSISNITQWYEASYPTDLALARKIAVESVNRFLKTINNTPQIRPHLYQYPYTANGLELTFSFRENPNLPKAEKQISFVIIKEGKIRYTYNTHTEKGYATYHEETFEEACAIVDAEEKFKANSKKNVVEPLTPTNLDQNRKTSTH